MATEVQVHERECAVCTNDFTKPKILPCGHLLCRGCVISWMESKSDAGCPLCTCPVVDHPGNSSQSSVHVADALPTDYVMEAIVESAHVLEKVGMCSVCDEFTAEYICMQCVEKMCPWCMKIHKKMVVSRSHEVESLNTVTPERLAASRPALCADHGDKPADIFCADHHLAICTECFSNKHNECQDVKYVDNKMNSAENTLGSLTHELLKAEDNLKQAIGSLNVRVQTADAAKQKNMALVDKTCDRLQKMVEESRKQMKKVISDSFSKFKNSLNDLKRELDKRLVKVTSHKHIVTRATTVRPRPALILAAQTLTDRINNLDLSTQLEEETWVNPLPEITKHCDDVVKVMKAELQNLEKHWTEAEVSVLMFRENCGTNIRLTNSGTTARMVTRKRYDNGVVVSRDAMVMNVLYEVRVDDIGQKNTIFLGVTGTPPTALTVTRFYEDLKDSVIIMSTGILRQGSNDKNNVGKALKSIKVGSRVGVMVDSSKSLHLYVDGHDQGVAQTHVTQPCFAVFDLRENGIQVTALPTSRWI